MYKTVFFYSNWRKVYLWTTLIVAFFSASQLLLIFRWMDHRCMIYRNIPIPYSRFWGSNRDIAGGSLLLRGDVARKGYNQYLFYGMCFIIYVSLFCIHVCRLLTTRLNKAIGIGDLAFSIGDDSITDLLTSIQFIPIARMASFGHSGEGMRGDERMRA